MALFWILGFALLAGVCSTPPPDRIVGGSDTTIEQYPSIVQVEMINIFDPIWTQRCAASIITNLHVLSAAHCFDGIFYQPHYRRIRAGATERDIGGSVIYIENAINHNSYGSNGYDGDISVVKLSTPLTWSPQIQPVAIVPQGTELGDNWPVVHAGWGHTTQGGTVSDILQDVTIFTVNTDLCSERYLTLPRLPPVTENMICAGLLDVGGADACQGDSGGPLYFDNNNAKVLVGIVSWGEGCANATFPGVSTRVSSYTNWIIETAV